MQTESIVYIVDDNEGVRKAMSLLMKSAGYISKLYASAQEFLDNYNASRPGCVLLDVRMPGMSGLELQERLSSDNIGIPVIIMTGHGDIDMAVHAMKNGARDFIEKPFRNQKVLEVIQRCLTEESVRWQKIEKYTHDLDRLSQLTRREHEIMQLLVDGIMNKRIASTLDISVRTVEGHRANIFNKLQIKTLPELVNLGFIKKCVDCDK